MTLTPLIPRVGSVGRVFRPTPALFLLLKLRRLSSRDLEDCLQLLRRCQQDGMAVDRERILSELAAVPPTDDVALASRRRRLREALEALILPR